MNKTQNLIQVIKNSKHLVFFGGAGVSVPSGIPDFRSATGLYSQKHHKHFTPEELISNTFYLRYPEEFFAFYKSHLLFPEVEPNFCHTTLSFLEKKGLCKAVVTQNIDNLHQKAGSQNVYELHGSVYRNYCEKCHAFYGLETIIAFEGVPRCLKCKGRIKPDVVLYEEVLNQEVLSAAIAQIHKADTLIIGGTSLVVYPAASLIHYFKGKNLVLINKSITQADKIATLLIHEDIAKVFEEVMLLL